MNQSAVELEALFDEIRLNEQEIYRQSLEEKDEKIQELQQEVRFLKDTLNSIASTRIPLLKGEPQAAGGSSIPKRWKI